MTQILRGERPLLMVDTQWLPQEIETMLQTCWDRWQEVQLSDVRKCLQLASEKVNPDGNRIATNPTPGGTSKRRWLPGSLLR